ncbi:hypothetical protein [Stappia indica]|uniref:hypothetical protein n=1 Tax=Stappia indica TaxID=538381 RepID=UPI00082A4EC6|nr:hypothetical protein [Stappia indica]
MIENTAPDMPPVIYVTDGDYKRTAPAFEHEHAYVRADLARQVQDALQGFLEDYVEGVKSGDWGFWDPEEEAHVIASRAALAKLKEAGL